MTGACARGPGAAAGPRPQLVNERESISESYSPCCAPQVPEAGSRGAGISRAAGISRWAARAAGGKAAGAGMGKVMGWGMRLTSARKQERAQRAPKQLRGCAAVGNSARPALQGWGAESAPGREAWGGGQRRGCGRRGDGAGRGTHLRAKGRACSTHTQASGACRAALCRVFVSADAGRIVQLLELCNCSNCATARIVQLCRFLRCSGLLTGGLCRCSAVLGGVRVAAATSSSARASNWRSRHAE